MKLPRRSKEPRPIGGKSRGQVAHVVSMLLDPHKDHREEVKAFKSLPTETIMAALNRVSGKTVVERRLIGDLFPKVIGDVRKVPPSYAGSSLVDELRWLSILLSRYTTELRHFHESCSRFELAMLLDDFATAREAIISVQNDFGYSLWSLEANLLVAERKAGLEEVHGVLAQIQSSVTNNAVLVIAQQITMRLERDMSVAAFDTMMTQWHTSYSRHQEHTRRVVDFVRFRSNFYRLRRDADFGAILALEGGHSLVDRYFALLRVLWTSTITRTDEVNSVAEYLELLTDAGDGRLVQLLHVLGRRQGDSLDANWKYVFDLMDVGRADDALNAALALLRAQPNRLPFYEMTAIAARDANRPIEHLELPSATIKELLINISHILTRDDRSEDSISALLKFAYNYDTIPIGADVYALCVAYGTKEYRFPGPGLRALTSSQSLGWPTPFSTIAGGLIWAADADRVDYTDTGWKRMAHLTDSYKGFRGGSPYTRSVSILAGVNELGKNAGDSDLRAVDDLLSSHECGVAEQALQTLTCIHTANRRTWDAICTCVRAYMRNHRISYATDVDAIFRMAMADSKAIEPHIQWPLFVLLSYERGVDGADLQTLWGACEHMLDARNLHLPSELPDSASSELIYFFSHVCKMEVLEFSAHLDSSDALEQERARICERLIEIDPTHVEDYRRELADLNRRKAVRRSIVRVDEARIYVDIDRIRKLLQHILPEQFARYKRISELDPELRKTIRLDVTSFDASSAKPADSTMPGDVMSCRIMFDDVCQLFLFSNEHGLDSYLSVRIRHGTISGQIRSVFERRHLVTRHDSNRQYRSNEFWRGRLIGVEDDKQAIVASELSDLSEAVDDAIALAKTKWIQVRSGASDDVNALFDFVYSNEDIAILHSRFVKCDNVEAFIEAAITELNSRLDMNLIAVRASIETRLTDKFVAALERCRVRCRDHIPVAVYGEFDNSIQQAETEIRHEMRAIAGWFRRVSDIKYEPFTIAHLVDTVIEMATAMRPEVRCGIQKQLAGDKMIVGALFAPLYDALYIMLDNVFSHAGDHDVMCGIAVSWRGNAMIVEVRNTVSGVDEVTLIDKLERMAAGRSGASVRSEGGTGYSKLLKIVEHDLGCSGESAVLWRYNNGEFVARLHLELTVDAYSLS